MAVLSAVPDNCSVFAGEHAGKRWSRSMAFRASWYKERERTR